MSICREVSSGGLSPTVVGALIAFVATLGAGALTEFAARGRARRAQELDWNRRLFDKYADAYRDFLASWGGAANVELLERTFAVLRSKALVPAVVVSEYEKALDGMRTAPDAIGRKRHAEQLLGKIDAMLNDPAGFVKG